VTNEHVVPIITFRESPGIDGRCAAENREPIIVQRYNRRGVWVAVQY